ncbi:hypothetical protein [Actinophytocola sp.]|uniref:hypothetical protein n=1 Tax=Actinophytocola sp. TaxID=1872138 RepID=UPI003899CC97
MEADLLRFYGVDLLDYHRGTLSARRVRVLIEHLPRDAALVRELHGETAEWGLTEHLLAAAVDELAAGNWLFVTANRDEHAEPPERPQPVPRPGIEVQEAPAATPEQLAAFFGGGS